jgi:hypothetical protein
MIIYTVCIERGILIKDQAVMRLQIIREVTSCEALQTI